MSFSYIISKISVSLPPVSNTDWQMVFMDFVGYIVALGAGQSVNYKSAAWLSGLF